MDLEYEPLSLDLGSSCPYVISEYPLQLVEICQVQRLGLSHDEETPQASDDMFGNFCIPSPEEPHDALCFNLKTQRNRGIMFLWQHL